MNAFLSSVKLDLSECERKLSRQQFIRFVWSLGKLNQIDRRKFDQITEVILSPTSSNAGLAKLNIKDIQSLLEATREFCQCSTYDSRLFDALL